MSLERKRTISRSLTLNMVKAGSDFIFSVFSVGDMKRA